MVLLWLSQAKIYYIVNTYEWLQSIRVNNALQFTHAYIHISLQVIPIRHLGISSHIFICSYRSNLGNHIRVVCRVPLHAHRPKGQSRQQLIEWVLSIGAYLYLASFRTNIDSNSLLSLSLVRYFTYSVLQIKRVSNQTELHHAGREGGRHHMGQALMQVVVQQNHVRKFSMAKNEGTVKSHRSSNCPSPSLLSLSNMRCLVSHISCLTKSDTNEEVE